MRAKAAHGGSARHIWFQKYENELLGRSGAHKRKQRQATFAVGAMNNIQVRKSLQWGARQKMHQNEQKRVVNGCGHRGLHWRMAQDGEPRNVSVAGAELAKVQDFPYSEALNQFRYTRVV
jgi:hypothetical protein